MVSAATQLNKAQMTGYSGFLLAWLILSMADLSYHHLIPLDETRYAAVAWEMWSSHDFLVPHLNGVPYHHKPPLLFWLDNLGWLLFGVNELWLLLISPLFALLNLFLLRYLARLLWPEKPVFDLVPWLLSGCLLWSAFQNAATFDILLSACVLTVVIGLIKASNDLRWQSWSAFTLGIALGLLTKGPVIFVPLLIPFIAAPYWSENVRNAKRRWYFQGFLAIALAIVLALFWAMPAAIAGGKTYADTLLWHQTVNRMTHSFAHNRSFVWYFLLTPVIFFPWFFWPRVWQNLFKRELLKDYSFRLCMVWFVSGFIGFSLISGKQIHYLIPLMPAFALMLARSFPDMRAKLKPGDYLPFLIIVMFGLFLMVAPYFPPKKLYHWLENRQLWWALTIILIGFCGALSLFLLKSISPKLLSVAVLSALTMSLAGFFSSTGNAFNLQGAAKQLEAYQKSGEPLAWAGKYDGQFQFLLKLTKPLEVIEKKDIFPWLKSHPSGHVISIEDANAKPRKRLKIEYMQYYREDKLWIQALLH